jgi:hypothetical protein
LFEGAFAFNKKLPTRNPFGGHTGQVVIVKVGFNCSC